MPASWNSDAEPLTEMESSMGWSHTDLTNAAGAPKAFTAPCAYAFEAQGTQHVLHVGDDNHIYELRWDNTGWHHCDLTNETGAPALPGDSKVNKPCGYVFTAQSTQHVNFVPGDCHVHELWADSTGWHHNDLTSSAGAPLAVAQPPCAYVFDGQSTQHVDYLGQDGHIHELWWDTDGWHHNDLTNETGSPLAAIATPTGYVFAAQGTQHVDYVGQDGHIHELWWDSEGWHHNDLTTRTGAPLAAVGNPVGYVFAAQGSQHIDYLGQDHDIHELSWDSNGWLHNDLTEESGAAPAQAVLCAYVFDGQGTRHVVYAAEDGDVHELWWNLDGWHYNDLTTETDAPPADLGDPAGYVFVAQGTQHVDYIGIEDSHIHELRWQSSTTPIRPVPPKDPI
jgi:hypothetical protein